MSSAGNVYLGIDDIESSVDKDKKQCKLKVRAIGIPELIGKYLEA